MLAARQIAVISIWPVCFASCESETGDTMESGFACSGHGTVCRSCLQSLLSTTKLGAVHACFFTLKMLRVHEISTVLSEFQRADDGVLRWRHFIYLSSQALVKKSTVKRVKASSCRVWNERLFLIRGCWGWSSWMRGISFPLVWCYNESHNLGGAEDPKALPHWSRCLSSCEWECRCPSEEVDQGISKVCYSLFGIVLIVWVFCLFVCRLYHLYPTPILCQWLLDWGISIPKDLMKDAKSGLCFMCHRHTLKFKNHQHKGK